MGARRKAEGLAAYDKEDLFREWYHFWSKRIPGMHPDPDYPGNPYNFRQAFEDRVSPAFDREKKSFQLPYIYRRGIEPFVDVEPTAPGGLRDVGKSIWRSDRFAPTLPSLQMKGLWRGGNKI